MSDRAILYARVSTGDKDTEASKLDAQLELCRNRADQEGYTVVAEHKEPEHTSGATQHPPELTKIIELAEQGEFDVLICRSLTRLARNISKQFRVEHILNKLGVRIEYYKYKFSDTAEGRFQKNIFASLAEYERENISFRTHYGKRNKVKSGKVYVNGIAPYGYTEHNVIVGDDVIERTLKVVPEEAEVIRDIFHMYTDSQAVTCAYIARHLTAKGIAPPGNKRYIGEKYRQEADAAWHGQTVSKLLHRKTYTGTWEYGKDSKDGTIPVAIEPIVDKQVWDKAQPKLGANKKSREHSRNYPYLVRDIAYCGVCGMPMNCKSDTRSNRPRYYSYWCSKAHTTTKQRCEHRLSYRADMIDESLWFDIKKIVSDPTTLKDAYAKYMQSATTRTNPSKKQLDTKQKLVHKNARKLEKLLDVYLDSDIPKNQYHKRKAKLEERVNKLNAEITAIKQEIQAEDDALAKNNDLQRYLNEIPDLMQFATGNKDAQMEILKRLGIAVLMYPEGEYKSVEWALVGNNMRLKGSPSSPLMRLERKQVF